MAPVGDPLANTHKKILRNDGESGRGWLFQNSKSPENTPKNAKRRPTENQKTTNI